MDFYRRYGILGAAGDRHLVEFMNPNYYLKDKEMIDAWKFALTTVDFRILKREKRLQELKLKSEGKLPLNVEKSNEEAIALIRSILGYETKVSNVNLPNYGQMQISLKERLSKQTLFSQQIPFVLLLEKN